MINLIREYLLKLVDNIDAGNSNLTEDETIKLISVLKELSWSRKDLDEFIQKSKSNHSLRSKLESQLA